MPVDCAMTASTCALVMSAKARSKSCALRTSTTCSRTPRARAATSASLNISRSVRFAEAAPVPEDGNPTGPRNGLLEEFETLADELGGEGGQPRDVAARPREALDEPAPDGIGSRSDDGNIPGRLLGG